MRVMLLMNVLCGVYSTIKRSALGIVTCLHREVENRTGPMAATEEHVF